MQKIRFDHLPKKPETKASCAHQAMMEIVINEGYATKEWQPMWARIIKLSGINDLDLKRLVHLARSLPSQYSPAGFVRNRLIHKDWTKYFE